jgi:hypothetical protein
MEINIEFHDSIVVFSILIARKDQYYKGFFGEYEELSAKVQYDEDRVIALRN